MFDSPMAQVQPQIVGDLYLCLAALFWVDCVVDRTDLLDPLRLVFEFPLVGEHCLPQLVLQNDDSLVPVLLFLVHWVRFHYNFSLVP